jgi:hypothetical protein
MKRFAIVVTSLLLLACAGTPTPGGGANPGYPGVSRPASGAICVAPNQTCDRENRCCAGTTCMPEGRFGSLCRFPFPG